MILISVLSLVGLGILLAAVLAVASRLLAIEEDPRLEEITEALPGANCGGCGYSGCGAYAEAVLFSPDVAADLCTVGGPNLAVTLGELVGKAVIPGEPKICFRRCSRIDGQVDFRYEYIGMHSCASADLLEDGPYKCRWACLGFADCLRACPFDAMYIKNDMVEINHAKCKQCGMCISVCPRSILQMIPGRARVVNHCATRDKLKAVSEVCDVGCINCLKCVKACPADAVSYEDNRVEIDHAVCLAYGEACNEACVASCPRGILRRCGETPQERKVDSGEVISEESDMPVDSPVQAPQTATAESKEEVAP